jgi:hypothetical protein
MKPRDTSKLPLLPPVFGRGVGVAPEMVEAMEAEGQRELVNSDTMPASPAYYQDKVGCEAKLLEMGFTLGAPDQADPLFRPVTLPHGWKRAGSNHSMWSYIVDDKGLRRVAMFYKAAFYDRRAFYTIESNPEPRLE